MNWISVDERLPEDYETCFLKWTYPNGNWGRAVGYLNDDEWEIEWSDNHPQSKHISHWLDERNLTSHSSRAAGACAFQQTCDTARAEAKKYIAGINPPPA